MKSEVLRNFDQIWLTCVGMLLFLGVFVGALLWIFRKESKQVYTDLSQLPLHESKGGRRES